MDTDHSIAGSAGQRLTKAGTCQIWKVNFSGAISFEEEVHARWVSNSSDNDTYFYAYPVKYIDSRAIILRPCGQDTFWLNWVDPTLYDIQVVREDAASSSAAGRIFSYETNPEIWRNDSSFYPRKEIELRRGHVSFSQTPRGRNNGVFLDTAKVRVKKKFSPYVGQVAHQRICDIHESVEGIWAKGHRPPVFQVL
jgi:hypothetical protein